MNSLDNYVTCPFNKSHRIIEARLIYHLNKCSKNYPKNMKVVCLFDATHLLDTHEVEHHLSICPSSRIVKCSEVSFEPERQVGTIPIEQACNVETSTMNEDWSGNHASYNPLLESENKNILRTITGLSKAKKKQFKQNERDRILSLENENSNNSNIDFTEKTIDFDQPLRAPKNVSKAVSYIESDSIDNVSSALNNVSINKISMTNNSLEKKNITILNNNSPKKISQESSLRNRTINTSNVSLTPKNTFEQEEKENICTKENIPIAMNYNISTAATNDSKVKDESESNVSQGSSLKIQGHCKETKIQKDNRQPNWNRGCSIKSRSAMHLTPQMTEKLYGAVKKISTGRGFTMAHQFLSSNLSQTQEHEDPKKFNDLFSSDDD